MAITRVKPAGWGVNEKLTSGQENLLDINVTYALDKRSGQTDTLASTVSVTGVMTFAANVIVNSGYTVTVDSPATFGGDVTVNSGHTVTCNSPSVFDGDFTIETGHTVTCNSPLVVDGNFTIQSGHTVTCKNDIQLQGWVHFDHTGSLGDAYIYHTDKATNAATGYETFILGQTTTGTASTGGSISIKSGPGTAANGTVKVYNGLSTLVATFGTTIAFTKALTVGGELTINGGSVTPKVSFSYAATVILDCSLSNHFYCSSVTGGMTITSNNMVDGALFTVTVVQDAVGGRAITWDTNFFFGSLSSLGNTGALAKTTWLFLTRGAQAFCVASNSF